MSVLVLISVVKIVISILVLIRLGREGYKLRFPRATRKRADEGDEVLRNLPTSLAATYIQKFQKQGRIEHQPHDEL